jgi:hypothetical protein
MAFGIDDAIAVGFKLIDKWFPSQTEKDKAKLDLLQMQQNGEFKMWDMLSKSDEGQSAVNLEEAKSDSIWKSGWRPNIGWVCGAAFAVQYVVGPLAEWVSALFGHPVKFPTMDLGEILPVLFGMLGLGAYRTYERVKGK